MMQLSFDSYPINMPPIKQRVHLTIDQKLELIKESETPGFKITNASKRYGTV